MDHFGSHTQNNYVRLARLTIENCQREQPTVESMVPVPKDDEGTPTDANHQIQLDKDMAAGPSFRPAAVNDYRPPAQAGLAEAAVPDCKVAASDDRSIAGNSDEAPAQAGLAEDAGPDYGVADDRTDNGPPSQVAEVASNEDADPDYRVAATVDRSVASDEDEAPATADRSVASDEDEAPAQAGLDEAVPADTNNNPSHNVEVKTKKKWFKRLRLAFSSSKPPVMSGNDKETTNNGIDKATAAGPPYMPADTNYRTAGNEEDEAAADGTNNSPSDFVEVKTKQKWFKRIKVAFTRMVRNANCCC
ncbi:hypothetical protein GBF38_016688 [Nibea albiflora]|uniref:Uncharacterized protein n=1 Tax=Nibea albiflora TaxID=240163 RepID=A0ACB7FII6_NIBAL|nr:hypothetical protein GBF38_016688 [Nibea albiflora]